MRNLVPRAMLFLTASILAVLCSIGHEKSTTPAAGIAAGCHRRASGTTAAIASLQRLPGAGMSIRAARRPR